MTDEGVIRFRADHEDGDLPSDARRVARVLLPVRAELRRAGWLGRDPDRYGGYAYGNLSARLGEERFVVSGTQTSDLDDADEDTFCVVEGWELEDNRVTSTGPVRPSSESLSHAALYQAALWIGVVLHVHAPGLFTRAARTGLPATGPDAEAGTVAIARDLLHLGRDLEAPAGVVHMAGHPDGLLAYGETAPQALRALAVLRNPPRPPDP